MKIYVNSKYWANINTIKGDIIKNPKYIIDKSHSCEFYTYSGIFRLIRDNFYKANIIKGNEIPGLYFNDHEFIFDTTVITFPTDNSNKYYQLPYKHHDRVITEYKIKTTAKSAIYLCFIVNQDDEVEDWYFVTNEEFETIKEDIFEFLSMFN